MRIQDDIKKAIDISDEIKNCIKSGVSISESDSISEFFSNDEMKRSLIESVASNDDYEAAKAKLSDKNRMLDIKKLTNTINRLNNSRVIRRRRLVIAASSIAAAILVGIYIVVGEKTLHEEGVITYATKITEPTLILEGDKRVPISSVSGDIVTGNSYIAKNDKSTIDYRQNNNIEVEPQTNRLVIPAKYDYTLTLADGSTIHLEPNSEVVYPTHFSKNRREIEVKGEAHLKIAKSDKPFIVKLNDCQVSVYGTEFRTYAPKSGDVEVVLLSGSVGFVDENQVEEILQPNELIYYNAKEQKRDKRVINPDYYELSKDMFMFNGHTLERIMENISNRYGVEIEVAEDIASRKIVMVISKESTLDDVFGYVEKLYSINIYNKGKEVYRVESEY